KLSAEAAKDMKIFGGDTLTIAMDKSSEKLYIANTDGEVGNKLASIGSWLNMSSKKAWQDLGGNTDENIWFDIAEEGQDVNGNTYYEITENRREAKTERVAKKTGDARAVESAED